MSRKGRPWTDERKEAVIKQHLNPFKVMNCGGVVVGVYRNSIQAERNGGFSSTAIRQCLSGRHKTHKGFTFEKITVDEYKELTGGYEDVKSSFLKNTVPKL
ncbi:hypothetical protein [Lactococcus garvieae]|uniref:hypothetical protein n=1 Tax=Lactococcus garvieae TaxID=1363 RepID=UPI000EEB6CEE|nr:hypothetical protein [Lactococcus garvieae]MBS4464202.1 hypothetical protein [Lactococcus garvieae]MDN5624899.1 hypothetical protein [Acinetobacter sp.]UHU65563.1 hypothetical protein C9I44_03590 [Lactococcus garvieae]HCS85274.1 hypothetical protein [Lactococcus garvieae]